MDENYVNFQQKAHTCNMLFINSVGYAVVTLIQNLEVRNFWIVDEK